MKNTGNLHPIAIEYLRDGLTAEADIYCYSEQNPLLVVRQGVKLTSDSIQDIKRVSGARRNVYVSTDFYQNLLGLGLPKRLHQSHLEQSIGYAFCKQQVTELIHDAAQTGIVSTTQTELVLDGLSQLMQTATPALLLQCIHGKNEPDEYLYTHSLNVALLNGLMASWLKLSAADTRLLLACGLLHDVGKTKTPPEILFAPRKLSPEEFDIMKRHALDSFEILKQSPGIPPEVAFSARFHHEKMNGTGYPDGRRADEIPYFSCITALSDVYDAMISERSYQTASSPFNTLEQLSEDCFSDLDYSLSKVFLENLPRELVGKFALLSNGSIGTMRYVDPLHWHHPIIDVDGEIFSCSGKLFCVSIAGDTED